MSTAASKSRKNFAGSRKDIGWNYGHDINGDSKNVKCNYCGETFTSGIYRFKHHLAGTRENVKACISVPDEVRKLILEALVKASETAKRKKNEIIDLEEEGLEAAFCGKKRNVMVASSNKKVSQVTINEMMKREQKEEAYEQIARFFYTSGISFNCVNNPEFGKMLDKVGRYGVGLKPPSYYDISEKYLRKEVIRVNEMLEDYRQEWRKTGCSIMSDGWTDKKHRSICNFLVNSPKGTVFLCSIDTSAISKTADKILEMLDDIVVLVGVQNVVQVVTDNAANYKLAGEKLMEKRSGIFWTPCAAHCIDLMLEDFEKNLKVHRVTIAKARKITTFIYARTMLINWMKAHTNGRDLIRPAVTRFATAYLTLGCLSDLKGGLMTMFTSKEWRSSKYAKLQVGKQVQATVLDSTFWKNVTICLKAAYPLIKVLRLVDSDYKPAMGFIYGSMCQAKETIQANFNNVKKSYEPIWKIIDARWSPKLHRPLHAAAFYLNPQYHYETNFKCNADIKTGPYNCIAAMVSDEEEKIKIHMQLVSFRKAEGLFGNPLAIKSRKFKDPADWWDSYGDDCPELQKFAIRVLSLTVSASGCERNWSAFEMVHTKRRNRLHQKKMNDLVFVMYNLKLMERQNKRVEKELSIVDIPSDDEWITEKEDPVLPKRKNWIHILDKAAENVDVSSDEEGLEPVVNTSDTRATMDAEDDLVIHDDIDNDKEDATANENEDNIEALDKELTSNPNVPEEEYDEDISGDEDDVFGGDHQAADFY